MSFNYVKELLSSFGEGISSFLKNYVLPKSPSQTIEEDIYPEKYSILIAIRKDMKILGASDDIEQWAIERLECSIRSYINELNDKEYDDIRKILIRVPSRKEIRILQKRARRFSVRNIPFHYFTDDDNMDLIGIALEPSRNQILDRILVKTELDF